MAAYWATSCILWTGGARPLCIPGLVLQVRVPSAGPRQGITSLVDSAPQIILAPCRELGDRELVETAPRDPSLPARHVVCALLPLRTVAHFICLVRSQGHLQVSNRAPDSANISAKRRPSSPAATCIFTPFDTRTHSALPAALPGHSHGTRRYLTTLANRRRHPFCIAFACTAPATTLIFSFHLHRPLVQLPSPRCISQIVSHSSAWVSNLYLTWVVELPC